MPAHEAKQCARCRQPFECKAGSITQCNCTQICLSEEEKAFIADRYEDCLCLACLQDLKNKYLFFKEKYFGA
jgi:hypothetical protein